jgi:hypothetical protein
MAQNVDVVRQIYNTLGVAVSASPGTGYFFASGNTNPVSGANLLTFLPRVQSVSLAANIPRQDINQYGQLDRLDNLIVAAPTFTANITYYPVDGFVESVLGFAASGQQSFISGLIDGTQTEKNYFFPVAPEGVDLIGLQSSNGSNVKIVALGNGVISNYNLNLAVGQVPTSSITVEGTNQQSYTGSVLQLSPAIDPNTALPVVGPLFTLPTMTGYTGASIPAALRPGDIVLSFPRVDGLGDYTSGIGQLRPQSVSLSVPLALDPINQLGNPYPVAKKIRFPVDCTLSIDALQGDITTGNVANLFCSDTPSNFVLTLNDPSCTRTGPAAITIWFNQAKLVSRDYSSSIGQNSTVRLTYTNQIQGISSNYFGRGIVWSGSYGQTIPL